MLVRLCHYAHLLVHVAIDVSGRPALEKQMRNMIAVCFISVAGATATAAAQWTGPTGAMSRIDYVTGNTYVGTAGFYNSLIRSDVVDNALTGRVITFHAFAGTPTSGVRTTAIWGETNNPTGRALQGFNFASTGAGAGVWAESSSVSGTGIHAKATSTTGSNFGGFFEAAGDSGTGVWGESTHSDGGYGGVFYSAGFSGVGVMGVSSVNSSAFSPSGGLFTADCETGVGVLGRANSATGITIGGSFQSMSSGGTGVLAYASSSSGTPIALDAVCNATGGLAGAFTGNVTISGTIAKGGGSFKIDHPLDPENKYLYHSFVESPDMKNIYDGNVVTDESGYVTVKLPDYCEALNQDFRYQLTVLDESDSDWVMVKIVKKIQSNQFTIRTSSPNVEVSWLVTGIRKDAFANENRIPIEVEKEAWNKGRYLHPSAFGKPATLATGREGAIGTVRPDPRITRPMSKQDEIPPLKPAILGGQ